MLVELYQAGLGDGIIADLGTATELEAAGHGTIVFRHLDSGGLMPNSVYYCRTDRVEELRDRLTRFVDAIAEAMRMTHDTRPGPARRHPGRALADQGSRTDGSVVDALATSRVWETVAIDDAASDRWMRILADEGDGHQPAVLRRPGRRLLHEEPPLSRKAGRGDERPPQP